MASSDDLSGRRALVTGGCAGIGLAIVRAYRAAGARVAVLDRQAASDAFRAELPDVPVFACDVAEPDDIRKGFDAAVEALGGLDTVVANAGVSQNQPTLDLDFAGWRKVMSVNLDGVFLTAHEAGRRMAASGGGSILLMASMYGVVAAPERLGYCVSKSGTVMMAKALAVEWAKLGIRVNALAPGYVRTPFVDDLVARGRLDPAKLEARTPIGRMIDPTEIADAARFLASDAARAVTGQVFGIDGGWTANGYL